MRDKIAAGVNALAAIVTTATGTALYADFGQSILSLTGWAPESVGLSEQKIFEAAVAGAWSVGTAIGIVAAHETFNHGFMKGLTVVNFGFSIGALTSVLSLPAGALVTGMLDSGAAAGYTFAVGGVGAGASIVVGVVVAGTIYLCCECGARRNSDVNVIEVDAENALGFGESRRSFLRQATEKIGNNIQSCFNYIRGHGVQENVALRAVP